MAAYITSGTTESNGADFSLTDGQTVTLFLIDAAGDAVDANARADVQIKSAGGEYFTLATLTGIPGQSARVLCGAGTYRVVRRANAVAFGVDKE